MAVLTQVHVVSSQFGGAVKQFRRADKLWNVEKRLTDIATNQRKGGAQSEIEKITIQTSAIAAELRRYQTYARLQMAYGKLQAIIGIDPLPEVLGQETLSEGVHARHTAVPPETPRETTKIGDAVDGGPSDRLTVL